MLYYNTELPNDLSLYSSIIWLSSKFLDCYDCLNYCLSFTTTTTDFHITHYSFTYRTFLLKISLTTLREWYEVHVCLSLWGSRFFTCTAVQDLVCSSYNIVGTLKSVSELTGFEFLVWWFSLVLIQPAMLNLLGLWWCNIFKSCAYCL